jgi:hemerythrin
VALLTWNDKHKLGVEAMDGEHLELYEAINELHDAVVQGVERNRTAELLHKVMERTRAHFASEEAVLASTKYPDLAAHRLKHQALVEEIEELAARFENGDVKLTGQSLNFLRYWFNAHIQNDDLPYGAWLLAHGVR